MNKDIMIAAGLTKEVKKVEEGKCPLCDKSINYRMFKNLLSLKEFKISGICQDCQDVCFEK